MHHTWTNVCGEETGSSSETGEMTCGAHFRGCRNCGLKVMKRLHLLVMVDMHSSQQARFLLVPTVAGIEFFAPLRFKLRTEPTDAGIIVGFLLFENVVLLTPSRNSSTAVVRHGGQKMCGGGILAFGFVSSNVHYRPGSSFPWRTMWSEIGQADEIFLSSLSRPLSMPVTQPYIY